MVHPQEAAPASRDLAKAEAEDDVAGAELQTGPGGEAGDQILDGLGWPGWRRGSGWTPGVTT